MRLIFMPLQNDTLVCRVANFTEKIKNLAEDDEFVKKY